MLLGWVKFEVLSISRKSRYDFLHCHVSLQVSVQTGLSREMDCLKDQLDVMREAWHNLSDTSGRYEWEEPEPGSDAHAQSSARAQRLPSLRSEACLLKLPSLMQRSEACLAGPESSQSQSNLLEHSYTVSRTNLAKVKL